MTGREQRQLRALVRLFAYRFFDTDIVSVRGDLNALLSQVAALLSALSFVMALIVTPKYAGLYAHLTTQQLRMAAWADEEFLLSTSMAVVGMFTLLLWDALFPDQRDCLILGSLPVSTRTVFAGKLAALAAAMGLATLSVNCVTALVGPFLSVPDGGGFVRVTWSWMAWWLVILLAAAFVFLLLVSVQGVALHLLPHGMFLRWSNLIQLAAFFGVLSLYFLTPSLANSQALAARENAVWFAVAPSYWFFGLFEVLVGSKNAACGDLARRALAGVGGTAIVAVASYALAYQRQMRRAVEQSGIVPARRGLVSWAAVAKVLARRPPERAILAFIARTLARSRQHRLLLAVYGGMGLAYVFSQTAYVMYHFRAGAYGAAEGRRQTELGIPLIMLLFLIMGLRVSFSIPIELRANWLFRLVDRSALEVYLTATRKALLVFTLAPVVAIAAPAYLAVWPWPMALGHAAFLAALGLLMIELTLYRFVKVPFTCAYLPGKANLKIRFGVYWGLLIIVSELVTGCEQTALQSCAGYTALMGITLLAWLIARHGRGARTGIAVLRFEEQPEPVVAGLGLAGPE
jgi:hypothetical protein